MFVNLEVEMWWTLAAAHAVTLEEAWDQAEQSPELAAVAFGAERSRATVGLARAALLPKVALSGSGTWQDEEVALDLGAVLPPAVIQLTGPIDPFVVQPQSWWQASATAIVPIVDADAWATLRAADSAADGADADVDVARRQLRAGVGRAFYGALLARDAVTIAEEALAVARRQEDIARAVVAAGSSPPRTALEAEQARWAAERDLAGAIAERVRAEEALRRFTGLEPGTPLELGARSAPPGVEGVLGADRPERRAADARVVAADQAHAATALGWVPDVQGKLTYAWTQNEGFAPNGDFLIATVEASWVWDGGARSARAREADAAEAQARAARGIVDRRIEEEVRSAWAAYEGAKAATAAATRERDVAQARLVEAEKAFEVGVIPFVELSRAALGRSAAALAERSAAYAEAVAATELGLLAG